VSRRRAALVVLALLATFDAGGAFAARYRPSAEERARIAELPPQHQAWLEEAELLLGVEERASFLALREDYQRDAFIDKFWRSRDPYPETARNEMRDKWQAKIDESRALFGTLADERSRFYLLNGPPSERIEVGQTDPRSGEGSRCRGVVVASEVWWYEAFEADSGIGEELMVLFYRPFGVGPWRIWDTGFGIAALGVPASAMLQSSDPGELLRMLGSSCGDAGRAVLVAVSWIAKRDKMQYPILLMKAMTPPEPESEEWLSTFLSYSTEPPAGAAGFPATVLFDFPGRRQSRTWVQGTVWVETRALSLASLGGARSYNLVLTGEVLRHGELFDRFRYQFDVPAQASSERLPLVFQRLLRPGDYRMVLMVEDLSGKRFFRSDQALVVPVAEGAPSPGDADPETTRILAEANALLFADAGIELLAPLRQGVLAGKMRFDALVSGDSVGQVVFYLDGKQLLAKHSPPWSIELDLGHQPRTRTLRVAALDRAGREVASDEILLNASTHRFAVTITSPPPGQRHRESVRVAAKVELPEGQRLDRLEIYRDEVLVATLYQPPYEQPILLPAGEQLTALRAVAYLPDGNATEDHAFVNAPPGLEEVSVQLVELYTAVSDRNGRPAVGLEAADFVVKEDGAPQQLVRFEQVGDLPIHAAVLLDTSASMEKSLGEAQQAALAFFTDVVTPRDRAALITFNDRPRLRVKLTNELPALGGGLAGLKAERGTALYDSLVFSLFFFNGVSGQRALIVLSDGKDESSRFGLPETLEVARRAGVTVYAIGMGLGGGDYEAQRALARLADETGGRSFFVETAAELLPIYRSIEEELRSKYLLVYQSTNAKPSREFRKVEVKVTEPGLEAHTLRGYYP
jgi:Ca-activated chloride channel homolog